MFRKSALLAVAAAAAFGATLLAPTPSDAAPGVHSGRPGITYPAGSVRPRLVRPGRPDFGRHRHPRHPHWHGHWRPRPVWYAPRPVIYAAAPAVVTTNRCTCLTKEYTQEGAVLFKDNCTNEIAMNPPAQAQPPQQIGAVQQPQYAQPQAQYAQPQPQYTPQYPPQTQAR